SYALQLATTDYTFHCSYFLSPLPPQSALFPYTTLFRSELGLPSSSMVVKKHCDVPSCVRPALNWTRSGREAVHQFSNCLPRKIRSEETRLNSSHVKISYAVFCLKKKTNVLKSEQS